MGASVAWHLRQLGIEDVVLLERDVLASGSTSKSAGGFRTQFADELNVRIALRSLDELERMDGVELHQHGYLFLLDNAADVERFRAALALQHGLGVPSRELSVDEALAIVPQIDPEGLLAATFCELDGYVSPEDVVQWYARGTRRPAELRGHGHRRPARPHRRCGDDPGPDRDGDRRLLRGRVVAGGRRDGRRRHPRARGARAGCTSRPRTAGSPRGCR